MGNETVCGVMVDGFVFVMRKGASSTMRVSVQ